VVEDDHHVVDELPLVGVLLGGFSEDVRTYFAESPLIRLISTDL